MSEESMAISFIEELNEDCLLKILDYLALKDQIKLWQATKSSLSPSRLNSLLTYNWQKQSKHVIDREIFIENSDHLDDFLECIGECVEELEMRYLPINLVETFRKHEFPYLRKLYYYADEDDTENDEDIALLTEIFPSLTSLVLSGMSTGLHISKFRNLTELDLEECLCLRSENFMDISENLKLKKLSMQSLASNGPLFMNTLSEFQELEELTLSLDLLTDTDTVQILRLPKLRKLRYNSERVNHLPFNTIVTFRGLDICRATFNDSIYSCNSQIFSKLQNLHTLTIIEDDGWSRDDLMKILDFLPSLEEVNLIDTHILRDGEQLWDMVRNCPKLKLLHISNNSFYYDFLTTGKEIMAKTLNRRDGPLQLNLFERYSDKNLSLDHLRHHNLKVSFHEMPIDYIDEKDIQVEFKPWEL